MADPKVLETVIDMQNGEYEVSAKWAADNLASFRFIDVREPHELAGPLGATDTAENIPLLTLLGRASTLQADEPVVLICRSGRRSAEAARQLRAAGITAASVEGGMIAWNTEVLGRDNALLTEKAANSANLEDAVRRINGLPEVSAQWTAANIGRFKFVDVREASELARDGRVPQAEHIPLGQFMQVAQGWERDAPVVVMCKSGGRSGRAVWALQAAGFTRAASMEGGMIGWRATGLPFR